MASERPAMKVEVEPFFTPPALRGSRYPNPRSASVVMAHSASLSHLPCWAAPNKRSVDPAHRPELLEVYAVSTNCG
jgi:hypothetical protein